MNSYGSIRSSGLEKLQSTIDMALRSSFPVEEVDGGLRVTTHCIYPSNGLVRVFVRGGLNSMSISDDGGALGEAWAAGLDIEPTKNFNSRLIKMVQNRGLIYESGVIRTNNVPIEAVPVAIAHVANVSKEIAFSLYETGAIGRTRDFKFLLKEYLTSRFRENLAPTRLIGASHKLHSFDNVVSFPNGKRLIIDPVSNDPSSINARVVANLDLRQLNDPQLIQRIIYDDGQGWSAENLSLLTIGANAIPFSKSQDVISRVAEASRAVA